VCRYGGDEFVVILPQLADAPDDARTPEALMRVADQSMYREKSQWPGAYDTLRHAKTPARRRDDFSERTATP
jgi:GGDEF domain-containing protein